MGMYIACESQVKLMQACVSTVIFNIMFQRYKRYNPRKKRDQSLIHIQRFDNIAG